jgi:gliding motility-associated-like protein
LVYIKNILLNLFLFSCIFHVKSQCAFIFDLGPDKSMCIGDSTQLIAPNGYSYSWTPLYNISSNSISSPYVKPTVDTTYYVSVTDLNNCTVLDSIKVFINPLPTVTVNEDDTICEGTTIQLIGTGALSYTWTPNYNLTNNTIPYPIASPLEDTSYVVNGVDANGCSSQDTIMVTVLPIPNADAGSDTSICPGSSVQLNATGGVSYTWLNPVSLSNYLISNPISTPTDSIKYFVQVSDLLGCEAIDSISINIFSPANADAGFSVSTCADDPVQLTASGGINYSWSPQSYLNHSSLHNPMAFPDDDMDFVVQVEDLNGCFDTDTMRVTVFKVSINNDTLFCKGDSLKAFVGGDPATHFLWTPSIGVSDSSSFEPWIKPSQTTTYNLKAINAQGCSYEDKLTITIPNPEALIDTNIIIGCEGTILEISNSSDPNYLFVWDFEDGTQSTELNLEKIIPYNSNLMFELSVLDQFGCMDTSEMSYNLIGLDFDDYYSIKVPNVFTPNNDGINDLFKISLPGRMYECATISVFNKWGQIQYFNDNGNLHWDGTNNSGVSSLEGTYFYTISIKHETSNGSFQLFR